MLELSDVLQVSIAELRLELGVDLSVARTRDNLTEEERPLSVRRL